MIQVLKKEDQFNDVIFGGRFFANKPVFNGQANVKPFSSLFYWSNAYAQDDCAFGLHPHKGFEIMTFLWEGSIEHYDTATRVWTPLQAGDFQIIQSNSGIQHQEKIAKGSRAFQIWFDPNYQQVIKLEPNYVDYKGADFQAQQQHGLSVTTYIGEGSKANARTPGLRITRYSLHTSAESTIPLDPAYQYQFYVLNGSGHINSIALEADDAFRVQDDVQCTVSFTGELFCIGVPGELPYTPIGQGA